MSDSLRYVLLKKKSKVVDNNKIRMIIKVNDDKTVPNVVFFFILIAKFLKN
jgi:hypothetical protein